MALVHAPEVKSWLSQFTMRSDDAALARALIENLRIVSHTAFHQELTAAISRAVAGLGGPIAFYAVREMDKARDKQPPYFTSKRLCPNAAKRGREVGSEGVLGDVATSWSRRDPSQYLNHPAIATLHKRRCRHIVLLDDISGSGVTASNFISAFCQHKTIKSWLSYGWIQFHWVGYAISEEAEVWIRDALRSRNSTSTADRCTFWYSRRPELSPLLCEPTMAARLHELCTRYGKFAKVRWQFPLGYRESFGTILFSRGCPNNVPGIIWHESDTWRALCPNRTVPPALEAAFDQQDIQSRTVSVLFGVPFSETVFGSSRRRQLHANERNLLLVLRAIQQKIFNTGRLSLATSLSTSDCETVIAQCSQLNLIDSNRHLTPRGIQELRAATRLGRLPTEPPPLSAEFYFPRQLRAARESF